MKSQPLTKDELLRWFTNKIGGATTEEILSNFVKWNDEVTLRSMIIQLEKDGLIYKYNGQYWFKNKK